MAAVQDAAVRRIRALRQHSWAYLVRQSRVLYNALRTAPQLRNVRDLKKALPPGWKGSSSSYSGTISYTAESPEGVRWRTFDSRGAEVALRQLVNAAKFYAERPLEEHETEYQRRRGAHYPSGVFGLPLRTDDSIRRSDEASMQRSNEWAAIEAAKFGWVI